MSWSRRSSRVNGDADACPLGEWAPPLVCDGEDERGNEDESGDPAMLSSGRGSGREVSARPSLSTMMAKTTSV